MKNINYFYRATLRYMNYLNPILKLLFGEARTKKQIPFDKFNKIIIIYPSLIGDIVMLEPFLRCLKDNNKMLHVTLVSSIAAEAIYKNNNLVDKIIPIQNGAGFAGISQLVRKFYSNFLLLKQVNRLKYDCVVEPMGSVPAALFSRFVNAENRIGFDIYDIGYLFTTSYQYPKDKPLVDTLLSMAINITNCQGISSTIPEINISNEEKMSINNLLCQNSLKNKYIIGIHPGASSENRQWHGYASLIEKINSTYSGEDIFFFVFCGPGEEKIVDTISGAIREKGISFMVIKKGLRDYICTLSVCKYVVCNDSSCAHIAGALGIPMTVIFGKGVEEYITPKSKKNVSVVSKKLPCKPCVRKKCLFDQCICISDISVEDVFSVMVKDISRGISLYE